MRPCAERCIQPVTADNDVVLQAKAERIAMGKGRILEQIVVATGIPRHSGDYRERGT